MIPYHISKWREKGGWGEGRERKGKEILFSFLWLLRKKGGKGGGEKKKG